MTFSLVFDVNEYFKDDISIQETMTNSVESQGGTITQEEEIEVSIMYPKKSIYDFSNKNTNIEVYLANNNSESTYFILKESVRSDQNEYKMVCNSSFSLVH